MSSREKRKTKRSPIGDLNVWQGRKDSNPGHPVLETGVLPTELHPYGLYDYSICFLEMQDLF